MEQLHPGAKWLFRIRGYFGAIFFMIFISWFIIPFAAVLAGVMFQTSASAMLIVGIFFFFFYVIAVVIIAEIYSQMSYNRWFYEFTPDNLKIERGIIWKKYSNIPYERVQNVDITRGIIARLCGFSSVNIQTAGFSYTGKGMPASEGYIPAVSSEAAEKIREFLMKKISKKNSRSGL